MESKVRVFKDASSAAERRTIERQPCNRVLTPTCSPHPCDPTIQIEELTVLRDMLLQRIKSLEKECMDNLHEKAKVVARNKHLERQLKRRGLSMGDDNEAGQDAESEEEVTSSSEDSSEYGYHPTQGGYKKRKTRSRSRSKPCTQQSRSPKPSQVFTSQKSREIQNKRFLSMGYKMYKCPIKGCDKVLYFNGQHNPPLLRNGLVSDRVAWENDQSTTFRQHKGRLRKHFKEVHPEIPQTKWPFALRCKERSKKEEESSEDEEEEEEMEETTVGGSPNGELSATEKYRLAQQKNFLSKGYLVYPCPVDGCTKRCYVNVSPLGMPIQEHSRHYSSHLVSVAQLVASPNSIPSSMTKVKYPTMWLGTTWATQRTKCAST